jgi:hypothetical protein
MAEVNISDLQQTIIAQQQELGAMRHAAEQNAISAALHTAMAGHEFASAAAGQQVHQLLGQRLSVHRDGGNLVVTGPGYEKANDWVKAELSRPEFAHFLRSGPAPRGQAPTVPGAAEPLPGETAGAFFVRQAVEARAARQANPSNPNTDMSRSIGLRRRS